MSSGPVTDVASGARFVGSSDLAGRSDALQVMVGGCTAYVSHPFSGGFAVLDIADPRRPRLLAHVDAEPSTMTLHLQLVDDLLVCTQEARPAAAAAYARRPDERTKGFAAGLSVHDVSDPARPRRIGRLEVEGYGVHRLWWVGGDTALASYRPPGSPEYLLAVIDMTRPDQPRISSTWAPPTGATDPSDGHVVALHHAIADRRGRAFGAWRDGGVVVLDVVAQRAPRHLAAVDGSAWDGAKTHTALPLAERGIVVVLDEAMTEDCRDGTGGVHLLDADTLAPLGTCPPPADADYCARPGRFGPHNLHENRPGSLVSEDTIFCTYQNAGLRWYDVRDPAHPVELGYYVPRPAPHTRDPRVGPEPRTDAADVFVCAEGLAVLTDMNGGVTLAQIDRA